MRTTFLLTLCLLFGLTGTSRASGVDPFQITPDFFKGRTAIHQAIVQDPQGARLKVENTSYQKVLLLSVDGEWKKHGRMFEFVGSNLSATTTYDRGIREGLFQRFSPHQNKWILEEDGIYQKGKKEGVWKRYDQGHLLMSTPYQNDRIHGTQIEYRTRGALPGKSALEKEYVEGRLQGETRQYDTTTGRLIRRTFYVQNEVRGYIVYDANTGIILREVKSLTPSN